MDSVEIGDVVKSVAGRDKDKYFLVIDVCDGFAYIADGKIRKIQNKKRKNIKHLIKAAGASLISDAVKIKRGEPFGNEKLYKAINRVIQNF